MKKVLRCAVPRDLARRTNYIRLPNKGISAPHTTLSPLVLEPQLPPIKRLPSKESSHTAPKTIKAPLCKGGWLRIAEAGGLFAYTVDL